jgi:hypothetical protein
VLHDGSFQPALQAHLHKPSPPHTVAKPLIIFCIDACMADSLHDAIQLVSTPLQFVLHDVTFTPS